MSKHCRTSLTRCCHAFAIGLITVLFAFAPCDCPAEQNACTALRRVSLPPGAIGLPTTGAEVTSAARHHQGGMPFCRVLGSIHPVDPTADNIRFELNLPERWNGKALGYGGGTFDGWLTTANGLRHTEVGLASQPTPLARGYATFGSDSGHHKRYFPGFDVFNTLNARFARNAEERHNFDGDALKKVHDTVVALIAKRYGRPPARLYFVGGSTGGREGLYLAQRYPEDYDGVLAAYAGWDQVELDLQFMRTAQALYAPGGFLGGAQTRLVHRAVLRACDAVDGLRDGIVSDPASCHLDPNLLRCPDGRAHRGCLSAAQLHTLLTFATPQRTSLPMANGVDSIPGYNVLAGADLGGSLGGVLGLLHFPLHTPFFFVNSFGYIIGDDVTRNFISVGTHFNSLHFDTVSGGGPWRDEILHQSHDLDASDADLRPFFAHGGKLILVHGTEDTVIPTDSSVDFYRRVKASVGSQATRDSVRLYLIPGFGHGFGRFKAGMDTIGPLDAWVDDGVVPADLVVSDNHKGRTRPLCEWPAYARYKGAGDPNTAASFTCTAPSN